MSNLTEKVVVAALRLTIGVRSPAEGYHSKNPIRGWGFYYGDLTENRTPIARMKTWCPNR